LGEYFNNATLSGAPAFRRYSRSILFNWGVGSPSRAINRDNFSIRWTRTLSFASGIYRFRTIADDGVRVFVDNAPVIDAWADGPSRASQADVPMTAGLHTVRVEYYERTNLASVRLAISLVAAGSAGATWRAEFFNNLSLEGSPVLVRQDPQINFDWSTGSPGPQVVVDNFSARWTRQLSGIIPGFYNIGLRVDDGARVFVDGNLVINEWRDGAPRNVGTNVYLADGSTMRVEYYDRTAGAVIQLSLFPASAPAPTSVAPTITPSPVASFPNWRGEYYNNADLSGSPSVVRNDINIDFDWGAGSPDSRVPADNFSARWTSRPQLAAGTYRVIARTDDGARVYVNGQLVINEWRDGPPRTVSADFSIGAASPEVRVEYYDRGGGALIQVSIATAFPTTFSDWKGEYFNNVDQSGSPVVIRNDVSIAFDWGSGPPDGRVTADNFSARWSRRQNFGGGVYRIEATIDDAMRVYLDGNLVINEWSEGQPPRTRTVDLTITAGDHDLRVDYFERGGSAVAKVTITRLAAAATPTPSGPTSTPIPQPVPSATITPIP
jgi:single-stranded DNA-binding protein